MINMGDAPVWNESDEIVRRACKLGLTLAHGLATSKASCIRV